MGADEGGEGGLGGQTGVKTGVSAHVQTHQNTTDANGRGEKGGDQGTPDTVLIPASGENTLGISLGGGHTQQYGQTCTDVRAHTPGENVSKPDAVGIGNLCHHLGECTKSTYHSQDHHRADDHGAVDQQHFHNADDTGTFGAAENHIQDHKHHGNDHSGGQSQGGEHHSQHCCGGDHLGDYIDKGSHRG